MGQDDNDQATPAAMDSPFTAEEQAQWNEMMSDSTTPDAGAGAGGSDAGAAASADVGAGAGADGSPAAVAADGTAGAAGQQAAVPGPGGDGQSGEAGDGDGDDDDDHGGEHGAADQQNVNRNRRVAYSKYRRVEGRLKEREAENEALKATVARADERLKMLAEALTPPKDGAAQPGQQAEAEEPPDPEKDIFAYAKWQGEQMAKLQERLDQFQSSQSAASHDQQVLSSYYQDVNSYSAQHPEFASAYQHLIASRVYEMANYYFGKDLLDGQTRLTDEESQHIKQAVEREERSLAESAIRSRRSPAAQIMTMARGRGWRSGPGGAAAGTGAGEAAGRAGTPAKPAPGGQGAPGALDAGGTGAAAQTPSVADEVDRLRRGGEAAMSLSNAGGAPATPLDARKLASMSDDEFGAIMDRMSQGDMRALFGD